MYAPAVKLQTLFLCASVNYAGPAEFYIAWHGFSRCSSHQAALACHLRTGGISMCPASALHCDTHT